MADIFISYSKADRDKVLMLAAYLGSEGWTVWWDTNLAVGDAYRDEIMKQLSAARAVIVLWTRASIQSDFVRAEAGRAKADGKLIPVKENDVGYSDIPLPFGEIHTEDLSKRELIRAAVMAQLARPEVQQNALTIAAKALRYQALIWVGIVVGAVNLFVLAHKMLDLADWARWLVLNWTWLTSAFWRFLLGWTGWQVPELIASFATAFVSTMLIAIGARMRGPQDHQRAVAPKHLKRFKQGQVLTLVVIALLYIAMAASLHNALRETMQTRSDMLTIHSTVLFFAVSLGLYTHALWWGGLKSSIAASYTFMVLVLPLQGLLAFPILETLNPRPFMFETPERISYSFLLFSFPFLLIALMILIAPIRALQRRVSFLLLGVVIIVALNQLSLYAPEIRALLKPPA